MSSIVIRVVVCLAVLAVLAYVATHDDIRIPKDDDET
jgi:hypothetical protein